MATASIFICHAHADAAFAQDLALALETYRLVWPVPRQRAWRCGSALC